MIINYDLSYCGGRQTYLATPYSKLPNKDIAAGYAATWLGKLAGKGLTAVSPIVLGHAMGLDLTHEEWMRWCRPMFDASDSVVIPPIDGREDSKGIKIEMQWASDTNRPIIWLQP